MELAIDIFPPERFGRISGSRCTPLVPKRDAQKGMITLAKELARERFHQFYDEISTWQMEHGKFAENAAFEHYQLYINKHIKKGVFGFKDDLAWSTDAELDELGIDFKCPTTLEAWEDYLFEGISDKEYNQCQFYMMVRDKRKWQIASFLIETQRMTDNGITYPIPENKRIICVEVNEDKDWQDKFKSNLPFVVAQRDHFIQILKENFK